MVVDNPEGKSRLSLHSAQALGAGVTSTGHIDVILDRRLMQDDNRGLFQGRVYNSGLEELWVLFNSRSVNIEVCSLVSTLDVYAIENGSFGLFCIFSFQLVFV